VSGRWLKKGGRVSCRFIIWKGKKQGRRSGGGAEPVKGMELGAGARVFPKARPSPGKSHDEGLGRGYEGTGSLEEGSQGPVLKGKSENSFLRSRKD